MFLLSKRLGSGAGEDSPGPPMPDYLPPQFVTKPKDVRIFINGQQFTVPSHYTVLQACRENGFQVPSLCHHPLVRPTGRCGVCVVDIEGRKPSLQKSCKTRVAQDMIITTNSPEVLYQAQANLREFLGVHRLEDLNHTSEIEDLDRLVKQCSIVMDDADAGAHQYAIIRDQSRCISCTRCVRECGEIQNMNILSVDPNRPHQPISFDGDLPLHETDCVACGQCTAICPTGAVIERQDWRSVMNELKRTGPERKIMIIQTAPAARLSLGEMFGDEPANSPEKAVAALHALGFDYVFDTTFGADTTALLEAEELVERMKADGPWPMFTSCCPAWVILIEKKYPHLRPLLSRCKSPMMMLATMIRCWMKKNGTPRDRYFSVALMPCTAKKEEILRPELRDPEGHQDVDVVLTVREMGRLIKAMSIEWGSLPGKYKTEYDPPFDTSSGGGALFPVGGGVTEAALRAAYTMFTNEVLHDPERCKFDPVRKVPEKTGEYISAEISVTPDRRHKRPLDSLVINGTRAIQQFLMDSGIDTPEGVWKEKGNVFVECMACPGGCVNGGGQPQSLDPDIVMKRRKAVHRIDKKNECITTVESQKKFSAAEILGIKSVDDMHELMECDPPDLSSKKKHTVASRVLDKLGSIHDSGEGKRCSVGSGKGNSRNSMSGGFSGLSGSSTRGSITDMRSSTTRAISSFSAHELGEVCILYGSQAGLTASYAKRLFGLLNSAIVEDVTVHPMDHFDMDKLKDVDTLIILTSTWESDKGLMPSNAEKFWSWLKARELKEIGSLFSNIRFAVCGFGSQKYRYFCGFAQQLHDMFRRLGGYPFLPILKIDVDKNDRGQKHFTRWEQQVIDELLYPSIPEPSLVLLPSVAPSSKVMPITHPPNFKVLKVNALMSYKKLFSDGDNYFYLELSTEHLSSMAYSSPDQYLYIIPRNPLPKVEKLLEALYPGMANTVVSVMPISAKAKKKGESDLAFYPSHLTIKEFFECYVDLFARPALHFMRQMETIGDGTEYSNLSDILEEKKDFIKWASDKTYYDVLMQYRNVIPPIEVLLTMLPRMLPRSYTLLNQDSHKKSIAIMFKAIPRGTCTTYLKGLKRGDKVIASLGTSELTCRIDDLMQPFYIALGTSAYACSKEMQEKAIATHKTTPLSEFPLEVNVRELFHNLDRKPSVDETITTSITISNQKKDKYRFTIAGQTNERFKLSFEPSSGVVKSRFSTTVKVALTVFCTCDIQHQVLLTCEAIGRRVEGAQAAEEGMVSTMIPVHIESKLSPKLDFSEIKFKEQIGTGTYGTVSRGVWRGQDVAVKILKNDRLNEQEFLNECNLLQELRCPYVVNFVGYCISADKHCLLTEYMELGSLTKYIHQSLPFEYKVRASLDCARGMSFLHNCGMMHRDLKPDNLLVATLEPSEKVVVKLADFGTSREIAAKDMSGAKKMTGGVGTPIYMAPEVLNGDEYSASADVYSFGMVLFELFTESEPYLTPEFTAPWHIAQFVTAGKRLEIPPKINKHVADLIRHCWAHDPAKRPTFDICVEALVRICSKFGYALDSRKSMIFRPSDLAFLNEATSSHKKDGPASPRSHKKSSSSLEPVSPRSHKKSSTSSPHDPLSPASPTSLKKSELSSSSSTSSRDKDEPTTPSSSSSSHRKSKRSSSSRGKEKNSSSSRGKDESASLSRRKSSTKSPSSEKNEEKDKQGKNSN